MYTQVGACPHCGSPIYSPTNWMSILPPPSQYTCNCREKILQNNKEGIKDSHPIPATNPFSFDSSLFGNSNKELIQEVKELVKEVRELNKLIKSQLENDVNETKTKT